MRGKKRIVAFILTVFIMIVQLASVGAVGDSFSTTGAGKTGIYDSYAMSNLDAKGINLANANVKKAAKSIAKAPNNSTADVRVYLAETGGGTQQYVPSVWVEIQGETNTSVTVKRDQVQRLPGFAVDSAKTYRATITVPAGYNIHSVKVNAAPMGSANSFAFQVSAATGVDVDIQVTKNGSNIFHSNDTVKNQLKAAEWSATPQPLTVKIAANSLPSPPKPVDVVLLLDLSNSMSAGMDGTVNVPVEQQRISFLKNSVKKFINTLVEEPAQTSEVSIVSFGKKYRVELDWTRLDTLKNTPGALQMVFNQIDWMTPEGGTMSDLGFVGVRKQYDLRASSPNERHVVFFSDGLSGAYSIPPYADGSMGYDDIFYSDLYAGRYASNSFRVMAETLNQANILKGARGTTVTTNECVKGFGARRDSWAWVDYYGIYLGGYPYGDWSAAWQTYDNNSTPPPDYLISTESTSNFSTPRGGNFYRTGTGYGAKIYAVGLYDDNAYRGDLANVVNTSMNAVVTTPEEGEQNFFSVKNDDQMNVAFQVITGRFSSVYKDVVVVYYYDSTKYKVVDTGGGTPGQSGSKPYISWNVEEISPSTPFNKSVVLEALDAQHHGAPPGSEVVIGVLVNNAVKEVSDEYIARSVSW